MTLEVFQPSKALTLGVELELQLLSTHDYDMTPYAPDMLALLKNADVPGSIVPEVTASMIEISTGICRDAQDVWQQLATTRDALIGAARRLNIAVAGGGTHPFQQWYQQRIYDKPRFKELTALYGYLTKQFTIFGQHVHVGCPDADASLLMLHRLSRYIPHFIALSASSPFVQGQDTAFDSARLNSVFAFPLSGRAPFALHWEDFERYFDKMAATGVIHSMKDFYWDIRPKPGFGTVEVRVFDTPLSIDRAAQLAAYVQALAAWFLNDSPFEPQEDDYLVYTYNRFQACRFGLDGSYVDPASCELSGLREHIAQTLQQVMPHAGFEGRQALLALQAMVSSEDGNDASWLRQRYEQTQQLPEVVRQAALRFSAG
ncbi:glutamate--cysteine ligase [Comamonas testosteroni]|uniref:Putative glutamate--cysteine ligase 2 n=1 Tax=Comamonas testosteroni TaxID=285 RepID=A0A373FSC8_COMTE|nr:YbdK family carboxylate-amine ligase [Comamonas testosteroni]RGE47073.1 glutamate--cysteine ligase [Comamonas testosteroni]